MEPQIEEGGPLSKDLDVEAFSPNIPYIPLWPLLRGLFQGECWHCYQKFPYLELRKHIIQAESKKRGEDGKPMVGDPNVFHTRTGDDISKSYVLALLDQLYLWKTRPKQREKIEEYMIRKLDVPLNILETFWDFVSHYGIKKGIL